MAAAMRPRELVVSACAAGECSVLGASEAGLDAGVRASDVSRLRLHRQSCCPLVTRFEYIARRRA